jgi:hypothetical protein
MAPHMVEQTGLPGTAVAQHPSWTRFTGTVFFEGKPKAKEGHPSIPTRGYVATDAGAIARELNARRIPGVTSTQPVTVEAGQKWAVTHSDTAVAVSDRDAVRRTGLGLRCFERSTVATKVNSSGERVRSTVSQDQHVFGMRSNSTALTPSFRSWSGNPLSSVRGRLLTSFTPLADRAVRPWPLSAGPV